MKRIKPVTSSSALRSAFGCFPSGVTVLCAQVGESLVGLVASSFTSVSLEPALVSVSMQHSSTTWPVLRTAPRLGISVLSEGQEEDCSRIASKTGDRFAGTPTTTGVDGAVFVDGATLWLDCTVHAEVAAGDHDVVLLAVHGLWSDPSATPLVFHGSRFRRLVDLPSRSTGASRRTYAVPAAIAPWVADPMPVEATSVKTVA